MAESDNVLTKLHDLLVYLVPQLSRFPRDQKFVLGDRIEVKVLEVQESCLRAYYGRDKRPHLLEANLTLNRQDYGVNWNKTLDNGGVLVGDEVKIEINAEAVKEEAGSKK